MRRVLRPRGRTILPLLLLLAGCSRPAGIRSGAESSQSGSPFHEGEETDSKTESATSEEGSTSEGVPFRDGESLPVGTLFTVRLKDAIHSQPSGTNATFAALVDEPIVGADGNPVVPRGASVSGRIESASSSSTAHTHGYVRLTLDLVDIAGRQLPIQTSSLFARGSAAGSGRKPSDAVTLEPGRRLTFRLSEALELGAPSTSARR